MLRSSIGKMILLHSVTNGSDRDPVERRHSPSSIVTWCSLLSHTSRLDPELESKAFAD